MSFAKSLKINQDQIRIRSFEFNGQILKVRVPLTVEADALYEKMKAPTDELIAKKYEELSVPLLSKKEELEAELSSQLFRILETLPVTMLTDSDIWRYLSSEYFFEFTIWRDGENCALASFGASSSTVNFDCVPFRMFNRGLIAFAITEDMNDLDYAHIPGTDLWRSHILRVLTSYSPSMSQAILNEYKAGNLPTAVVRDVAKSLRKSRANVVFEVLDLGQSVEILNRELARTLASLNR
jgi:hypothetical protein